MRDAHCQVGCQAEVNRGSAGSKWTAPALVQGMDIFPLKTRVRANLKSNFSPAFLRERMPSGQTRLRHMRNVIMDAFAALSPEQTQAVKDHQQSPGHKGQLRAVLMHRRDQTRLYTPSETGLKCRGTAGSCKVCVILRHPASGLQEHLASVPLRDCGRCCRSPPIPRPQPRVLSEIHALSGCELAPGLGHPAGLGPMPGGRQIHSRTCR